MNKESLIKKCEHQFWKDRNPATCLNCGKTEQELIKEQSRKEFKEELLKKMPEKIKVSAVAEDFYKSEFYNGYNQALDEITSIIKGL